jgi:HD-GYP domain-containing protein (c-di-GMP phosphodiesterase class II)
MIPEQSMVVLTGVADSADAGAGNPGHSRRVATYVTSLLNALGTAADEASTIITAARLHDIGKLGLSEKILTKPGSLNDEEWSIIRSHSQRGADYLANTPELQAVGDLILHHHERFDGAGYPTRLRGQAIPFGSRVIAVADSFDAMIHDRPYRKGMYIARAMAILSQEAGSQWDREIVAAFLSDALPMLVRHGQLVVTPQQAANAGSISA